MRPRVTTRLEKRKNQIRSMYTRKLNRVEVVSRFLNPCTSYRISNSCFIDQRYLDTSFSEDNEILSILDWNSITKAKQTQEYVEFSLEPRRRQFELPPQYLIQRLKSLGNEKMHSLAMIFSQLLDVENQRHQDQSMIFPSNTKLMEQLDGQNYMIFGGEFTATGPVVNNIIISRKLLQQFNIDEEALMVEAVKFGRLSVKYNVGLFRLTTDSTTKLYLDKYIDHLKMKIAYHQLALTGNLEGIQYLQSMASINNDICVEAPQSMTNRMKGKVRGRTNAQVTMSSPVQVTINMKNVEMDSTDDESDEMFTEDTQHFDNIVEKECNLLENFISVPREARPKLRKKICKVRRLPNPLSAL